jgi:hypothetical protein
MKEGLNPLDVASVAVAHSVPPVQPRSSAPQLAPGALAHTAPRSPVADPGASNWPGGIPQATRLLGSVGPPILCPRGPRPPIPAHPGPWGHVWARAGVVRWPRVVPGPVLGGGEGGSNGFVFPNSFRSARDDLGKHFG